MHLIQKLQEGLLERRERMRRNKGFVPLFGNSPEANPLVFCGVLQRLCGLWVSKPHIRIFKVPKVAMKMFLLAD